MAYTMRDDPRARKAGRFIHRVRKEIQNAFDDSGMQRDDVAKSLGVETSFLDRVLSGEESLTLRMIADLAWALDAEITFSVSPAKNPMPDNSGETASSPA